MLPTLVCTKHPHLNSKSILDLPQTDACLTHKVLGYFSNNKNKTTKIQEELNTRDKEKRAAIQHTHRHMHTHTHTEADKHTHTEADKQTDRHRDRDTETDRDRLGETETEAERQTGPAFSGGP